SRTARRQAAAPLMSQAPRPTARSRSTWRRGGSTVQPGSAGTVSTWALKRTRGAPRTAGRWTQPSPRAFLFLVLAEFRGFSQFGVIGSLGIMIAFVAALVVLPALALALERVRPWRVPPAPPSEPPGARIVSRRFPYLALGTVLAC